jgi:hypothetical protein
MSEINDKLNDLLLSSESEVIEFREAKTTFDSKNLGQYFSALSNEANLKIVVTLDIFEKTHFSLTKYCNTSRI